jgi:hypothetical protein
LFISSNLFYHRTKCYQSMNSEACDHFGTKFYKEKTGLTGLPAGVPVSRRQFRLQPESRHLRDQQALLQRKGGQHRPGLLRQDREHERKRKNLRLVKIFISKTFFSGYEVS